MGSKYKKAVLAESVRDSLNSWCKRAREKSIRDSLHSRTLTARSTCSLESIFDDETVTVGSGTLTRSSSLNQLTTDSEQLKEAIFKASDQPQYDLSFRFPEHPTDRSIEPVVNSTLLDLFGKT